MGFLRHFFFGGRNSRLEPKADIARNPKIDSNSSTHISAEKWQINFAPSLLLAAGVYNSATQDSTILGEKYVCLTTKSDVASASNGFIIQMSDNNVDFLNVNSGLSVAAATTQVYEAYIPTRYWRIQYTNGGTNQASWSLTGTLSTVPPIPLQLRGASVTQGGSAVMPVQGATSGFPLVSNITQINSTALGSPVAAGSSASGNILAIQGVASGTNINIAVNAALPTGTNTIGSVKSADNTTLSQALAMAATTNAVALAIQGAGNASIYTTGGTWTGTIIFEGTVDGTTWFSINGYPFTVGAGVTTTTVNGQWRFLTSGLAQIRARCSVIGTNTATVSIIATTNATSLHSLGDSLPTGSNVIGAVTQSGTWNIGTVTTVTAVTAITNALPTGSNTIGAVTQASGPWTGNITQVNSATIGSPTAAGTSASGNILAIQGVTSGVPLPVIIQSAKRTYRAAGTAAVSATATVLSEFVGNATTTVRICRVILSGSAGTGGVVDVTFSLRTAGGTVGTSSLLTVVKADSGDATAASSTPRIWTATGGTLGGSLTGNVWAERVLIPTAAATGPAVGRVLFDAPQNFGKPQLLIGTGQVLTVIWTGTLTTPTFDITYEWTEE